MCMMDDSEESEEDLTPENDLDECWYSSVCTPEQQQIQME